MTQKTIAVFDFSITADSPAGSCVLQLLENLASDYRFVVFADRFENPAPNLITWVRVPLPARPVISRYVFFKLLAPIYYRRFIQRQGQKPDLVIATEGEFASCDICYVHFCHRAYLRKQILKLTSLRALVRYANHQFNAVAATESMTQARSIVVPSEGLARELAQTYGDAIARKITTISNPLDVPYFTRPEGYAGDRLRHQLGFTSQDIVLAFAALGDFERKGLMLILQAMAALKGAQLNPLKLLVVGGMASEIDDYTQRCRQLDLADRVQFVGFQSDLRPYLWLSDVFAIPSAYETFSLVAFQAAIAGLPVIATQLYGVEEFLQPGVNGWAIERDEQSLAAALKAAISRQSELKSMGDRAHRAASQYSIAKFTARWRVLLDEKLEIAPAATLTDRFAT